MNDPEIFEKPEFFEKVSKWSNSKSYHVKSDIWRPSTLPSVRHPRLRHFSAEKSIFLFFRFLTQNDSIREKIISKSEIWRLSIHSLCGRYTIMKIIEMSNFSNFAGSSVWYYLTTKLSGNDEKSVMTSKNYLKMTWDLLWAPFIPACLSFSHSFSRFVLQFSCLSLTVDNL